MKKILDFLIIFLLVFLVVTFFKSKDEAPQNPKVTFEVSDSSYSVPASVVLEINNPTSENIKLNTCKDIKINFSGENLNFPESFCSELEVKSGEETKLDYSSQYEIFSQIGNYVFKINLAEKQHIQTFEIQHKWDISKIFVGLFYAPIYNLMIFLVHLFSYSMGWAIIAITILIRIVLLYPQHKMMVSQKKLQTVQPKIKEIQEKYKGNSQMLGMKLMELYKKEKVNPMGSCGFLIIQMPILLVIYNVILSIKDPSNYYYIYNILENVNLGGISYNFFGLDLLGAGGISGIALGTTVGLIQYVQVKLSLAKNNALKNKVVLEKKKGDNDYNKFMPDPEVMNKFMLYGMPVMVGVFTYSLLAGVGLYWGMSTLFMIFQQLFVNKILKKSS